MNVYTPERYDERVFHLALGIEPLDAVSQQRLSSSVDVRPEEFTTPVDRWRQWRPGDTLTAALPRMHRHGSGRFVRRYDALTPTSLALRIVDNGRAVGSGRHIVPRRVQVDLPAIATVLAAEADPSVNAIPIWQRAYSFGCFPGATANLPARVTVLRGRVVRQVNGADVPVRWARVRGNNPGGDVVGWAHGDDRGEFVLVIGAGENDIGIPVNPLPVTITVGAQVPSPTADPADPLRTAVDPLWDLPIESITAAEDAAAEPTINGRRFLPEHTVASPISSNPINLAHGRETSAVFRIA